MAKMMSFTDQLTHAMKKMKLSFSSIATGGCNGDPVHVIPEETSPLSPFRKTAAVLSSNSDPFCIGHINDTYTMKPRNRSYDLSDCVSVHDRVMDLFEFDTPVLDCMFVIMSSTDHSNICLTFSKGSR